MTQTSSEGSGLSAPVAAGLGLLIGLAIGFGVGTSNTFGGGDTLTGEEPPIRVRNGSIELELLSANYDWEAHPTGQKKKWRIVSEPERSKEDYELLITATDISKCASADPTGKKIEFVFGTEQQDYQTVELMAPGKKTTVTAKEDLEHDTNDGKFLRYSASEQFIKRIVIDNVTHCTFASEDKKLKVAFLD